MAKELPYFKFFVSEWNDGDITLEDYEVQGLFINICSYYWSNECEVKFDKVKKKFKDAKSESFNVLIDSDLIKVDKDGNVCITFLNEQQGDRVLQRVKNQSNGAKGGRPKKQDVTEIKPTGLLDESELKAKQKAIREEKRREDEIRKENKNKLNETEELIFSEFKKITGKNIRVFDKKQKQQLKDRLLEGYLKEDVILAISNCKKDQYHIDNPQYLTLEFILRPDKLSKYSITQSETKIIPKVDFGI